MTTLYRRCRQCGERIGSRQARDRCKECAERWIGVEQNSSSMISLGITLELLTSFKHEAKSHVGPHTHTHTPHITPLPMLCVCVRAISGTGRMNGRRQKQRRRAPRVVGHLTTLGHRCPAAIRTNGEGRWT